MKSSVVALTVTYGRRWKYLSQVLDALDKDEHITKIVVVDNGSNNKDEMIAGVERYTKEITILRQEKNLGSAGGFNVGLDYVRTIDCKYVFILDDDNVPEEGSVEIFLRQMQEFGRDVVLAGNRVNIPHNEDVFFSTSQPQTIPKGTFFEMISFQKIQTFFKLLGIKTASTPIRDEPLSIVPNESFVYGGSFIPIDAIRRAPLPDTALVLYGDDIEYSWGIKRLGYESYVCWSPKIFDIEMSFGEGSQVVGLFSENTQPFKVYYRIRNMVLISRRNTHQAAVVLACAIAIWTSSLMLLGCIRYGINRHTVRTLFYILHAVLDGYIPGRTPPAWAKLP
ncbi:MAG: hypothetical protein RIQ41_189 [Candidatus Parcubacteria bacterium]|jgi:GT2 family glycosyltransferase